MQDLGMISLYSWRNYVTFFYKSVDTLKMSKVQDVHNQYKENFIYQPARKYKVLLCDLKKLSMQSFRTKVRELLKSSRVVLTREHS